VKQRVLIVDDSDEIRELLAFILESNMDVEVSQENSGQKAITHLRNDKNFQLILTDLNMPNGSGIDLFNFLKHEQMTIPLVFITSDNLDFHPGLKGAGEIGQVPKPFTDDQLLNKIKELILPAPLGAEPIPVTQYIPVRLNLLSRVHDIRTPLYVKINDHKYVRVTHEQFNFDDETFKKYEGKHVTHLYIERLQIQDFISEYKKKALSDLAWEEAGQKADTAHIKLNTELLRELANQLGWSEEIIDLAQSHAQKALVVAASNPDLHHVLQQFHRIEHYGYADHCTLLLLVSSGLAFKMGIADELTLRRLKFASLFHDMSLSHEQYNNKPKLHKAIAKRQANTKDIKDVLSHSTRAAELCRNWNFCPAVVDTIIFQHHELADGSGFPMGKKANELHPLSCLFIISEDFVHYFIEYLAKPDIPKFIQTRSVIYHEGEFAKIFQKFAESLRPSIQTAS
jgi:response regulator RpfG family c-di-GMP phosphodiesterase